MGMDPREIATNVPQISQRFGSLSWCSRGTLFKLQHSNVIVANLQGRSTDVGEQAVATFLMFSLFYLHITCESCVQFCNLVSSAH